MVKPQFFESRGKCGSAGGGRIEETDASIDDQGQLNSRVDIGISGLKQYTKVYPANLQYQCFYVNFD